MALSKVSQPEEWNREDGIDQIEEYCEGSNHSVDDNKFNHALPSPVDHEQEVWGRECRVEIPQYNRIPSDEKPPNSSSQTMDRSHVVSESPPKRRRMPRRNSITAPMLLAMTTLPLQEFDDEEDGTDDLTSSLNCGYDQDIDIAEDLVRHVQAKRTKR